ncbi:MAG: putative glucarate transporter [Chlamydiae bacterium]|nr:putative glucarate transporter [Chlamydiota bacterium]
MNIHEHPNYSLAKAIGIYVLAVLFLLYEMGLQVSPSVMAFPLIRDLNIDSAELGLMAGCYFYSYSIMQLPAGLLFDRFGARLLITFAVLVCVIGTFFFGSAHSLLWASLSRFLIGFGSAFAFTGVLVVSAFWFHPHHFALLAGLAQFFAAIGALGGAFPLALSVGFFGWRKVVIFLGFTGIVLSFLVWLIVRDYPAEKCSPSLVKTPKIMESIKGVFKKSQNWWSALSAFTAWGPITLFAALWGGPFLITKFNVSNEVASTSLSAIWIGVALGSPFFGWLSGRIKRRVAPLIAAAILGFVSTFILIYIPGIPFWSSYVLLFGLGLAACSQILTFAVIKDTNKPSILATAMGFNNMAVVLGGAIFQPLVGMILNWSSKSTPISQQNPVYTMHEFRNALIIMPICYLICFIVTTFFLKETHCQPIYLKRDAVD